GFDADPSLNIVARIRGATVSQFYILRLPVDTPPQDLHAPDFLNDLHPGDHIEIQWRRNKEFPYGFMSWRLHSSS
ncbi:hypothetical protein SOVF_209500, partial [Spinacia oleracea]